MSIYARSVLDGETIAGPYVRAACERHFRDLANQRTEGFPFYFDLDEANRRIEFFPKHLRLAGGQFERKRFVLAPAQRFIVGSLFGWRRVEDGFRRFRRAYIEEGKGNGKTPLAAGVGIILFCADREAGGEVLAAGPTKEQAFIIFEDAVGMVKQSPSVRERVRMHGANPVNKMSYPKTKATFRPISKDKRKSGPRPSCGLVDELHEHTDGVVLDMIERGFKWRRQPLLFMITNSGSDPQTVCGREHQHAVEVATGQVDFPESFSYVCALDRGDDWLNDPTCYAKANPLLGVTVTTEELDREVRQARAIPGIMNEVARLRFCVWTDAETAWMSRETLEPCFADFDPIALHKGKELSAGVDLSQTTDLTAAGYVVETGERDFIEADPDTGKSRHVKKPTFDCWVDAWTPRDTMTERALVDKRPYDVWVRDGHLTATPGPVVRLDFVAARMAWINTQFRLRGLGYDAYAFKQFVRELEAINVDLPMFWHPQGGVRRAPPPKPLVEQAKVYGVEPPEGLWFPGSLRALETAIFERRVRFRRSPVLASAMSAAATDRDANDNRWLAKSKATNRIDAAVALVIAFGVAQLRLPKQPDISGFLKSPVIVS